MEVWQILAWIGTIVIAVGASYLKFRGEDKNSVLSSWKELAETYRTGALDERKQRAELEHRVSQLEREFKALQADHESVMNALAKSEQKVALLEDQLKGERIINASFLSSSQERELILENYRRSISKLFVLIKERSGMGVREIEQYLSDAS